MHITPLLLGSLMMLGVDCGTFWPSENHGIIGRSGSDTGSSRSTRSITSNYFYQIFYIPTQSYIGPLQCCTIGNYCNITDVTHKNPDGSVDLVTVEFTPSTLAAVPFVYVTKAGRPTDYTAMEATGECLAPAIYEPSPDSGYYYYFSQFFTAAQ